MKQRVNYFFMMLLALGCSVTHAEIQKTTVTTDAQMDLKQAFLQKSLHENLTQEQARQAILKMAGEYKVDFRFEELYALKAGYKLKENDLSEGHETVIVLENTANKVSLQHILIGEGHVVKHWRQDWEYQPTQMWSYIGNYRWQKIALKAEEAQGKWLQTVWQVDDSPRYAGLGLWGKNNGVISWTSNETYRPLPRREHTTRNDYDVIIGINRQALTATGWVHEQDNVKFDSKTNTVLARELGVNQYTLVKDFDFKPAYEYWDKNKDYWATVRQTWKQAFEQNEVLALKFAGKDEKAHYSYFSDQAKATAKKKVDNQKLQKQVRTLLNQQLVIGQVK